MASRRNKNGPWNLAGCRGYIVGIGEYTYPVISPSKDGRQVPELGWSYNKSRADRFEQQGVSTFEPLHTGYCPHHPILITANEPRQGYKAIELLSYLYYGNLDEVFY